MANTQGMCSQFKVDLMNGFHAFGASVVRGATTKDAFKPALYATTASRGPSDTVYNSTGELANTGGYTTGGNNVSTGVAPSLSGTTAIFTPDAALTWPSFTSSAAFDCVLIYNS